MEYKDDLMKRLNSSHINFASDVKMLPARGKDGGITYNEGTSKLTTAKFGGELRDEDNVEAFNNINKTMAILTGKKDFKLTRQLKSFHALGHQIETALITNGWALTFKDVKENHSKSFFDWSYTFYFSK